MLQTINLKLGCPSTSLFPSQDLVDSAEGTLLNKEIAAAALIYGPDPGYQALRESVSDWLTDFYRPPEGPVPASRICISNGASGNLANILAKFTDPLYTRMIWMVEPTYFLACPIFEDAGFVGRLRGVPEDDEGIDIDFLRTSLQKIDDGATAVGKSSSAMPACSPVKSGSRYPKLYRHVIYCVPTFSNPSGKTMSLRRRESLVRLAREYDALIVADDVYDFLRWPAPPAHRRSFSPPASVEASPDLTHNSSQQIPPSRLVDIDRSLPYSKSVYKHPYGNTVSNGSFSKLIAPGIRVSWCEGTEDFVTEMSHVGSTRSGGAPSHMASVFVDSMLRNGTLQRHVYKVLVPTYKRRMEVMIYAAYRWLEPLGVKVLEGSPYTSDQDQSYAGGFFAYILFPSSPNFPSAPEIARMALSDHKLIIPPGEIMAVSGDSGSMERGDRPGGFVRGTRLSWSWHNEGEIEEGVRRLGDTIRELLGEGRK